MTIDSTGAQTETPFTRSAIEVTEEPIVTPTPDETEATEGAEGEEGAAIDFDIEDSKLICQSLWSIPGVLWGEHLILQPVETDKFANAFYRYCIKKGINPMDYFFDELPLILAGIGVAKVLKERHTTFKGEQKKSEKIKKGDMPVESRISTPGTSRRAESTEMKELEEGIGGEE